MQQLFERVLWNSRYAVLAAVIASLLGGLSIFLVATIDAYELIVHVVEYTITDFEPAERAEARTASIAHVVELIDGYLLGTVMLIFAMGLYELFISRIDHVDRHSEGAGVLVISSLDDLKGRLGKVVLMILIVRFFERALALPFETALEGLWMAMSIAMIGLALFLSHAGESHGAPHGEASGHKEPAAPKPGAPEPAKPEPDKPEPDKSTDSGHH